jgi:hypothetical protein
MRNSIIIIILAMFNFSSSCNGTKDENLSLIKKDIKSNALRIDGYYYYISPFNQGYMEIYFYYNNSLLIYPTFVPGSDFSSVESYFTSNWFLNNVLFKSKTLYGLYSIDNNYLIYERYSVGQGALKVIRSKNLILNDTSFQEIETVYKGEVIDETAKNRIYHFHQFAPKPDSTNSFIP